MNKSEKNNKLIKKEKLRIPYFRLKCIKSDYPHHLIVGEEFMVKPDDKDDDTKEVHTYMKFENRWCLIGCFSLSCFDVTPIKKWIQKKKMEKDCE